MIIGSDLKVNISLEGLEDKHLLDIDFTCKFYVDPRYVVTLSKKQEVLSPGLSKVDADNYVAIINSTELKVPGTVLAIIIALVESNRKEIALASTGIILESSPIDLT